MLTCCVVQLAAVEAGGPEAVAAKETELGAKTCIPRIIKTGCVHDVCLLVSALLLGVRFCSRFSERCVCCMCAVCARLLSWEAQG